MYTQGLTKTVVQLHVIFAHSNLIDKTVFSNTRTAFSNTVPTLTANVNMSGNHSTVVSIKSSFLRTQIRILSQPLQASEQFVKSTSIPTSTVREVAREANRILRRHNKATYPAISIRHVAEQIDRLYWDATIPESDAEADQGDISGGEETLRANDNFNSDK